MKARDVLSLVNSPDPDGPRPVSWPKEQPAALRKPSATDCRRCKHPAVYHGRALPRCDATSCSCEGYEPQRARR